MADKRWKSVERAVAAELNRVLSDAGKFSPIERIPLLGRDGPDVTINETGLVINVKSRKVIPDYLFPKANNILYSGKIMIFRLNELPTLFNGEPKEACLIFNPKMGLSSTNHWGQLQEWYAEMDAWTQQLKIHTTTTIMRNSRMPVDKWTSAFKQNCISAIILHRPRMPIGHCGVAIHFDNLRRLSCNLTTK